MTTKQVIVMRKDLNMRKGKMVAQGAHAAMAFITRRHFLTTIGEGTTNARTAVLSDVEERWLDDSFTKICVSVGSEAELLEIHDTATAAGLVTHLVTDNGLTEFDGVPTLTCAAIGPDEADRIDKITGHLSLL